jgi:hypothetical protein
MLPRIGIAHYRIRSTLQIATVDTLKGLPGSSRACIECVTDKGIKLRLR